MLTKREFETAVDNLTEDEFDDFDANFKVPISLKIELNLIFLILGAGSLFGVGAITISLRDAIHPPTIIKLILAIVALVVWFFFMRWFYPRLSYFFRRECLIHYMKKNGCLRTTSTPHK
jgi:hypothetical protein